LSGITDNCKLVGQALYTHAIDELVMVSNTRTAEMTKILENTYRAVNIALVNELKLVADPLGVDIFEAISAAATKPFGFTPFYPGPGLGGHCIPIDPFYLTWKAREYGVATRFIELAGAKVDYSDPHVPQTWEMRNHEQTFESVACDAESLRGYDCVVVCTDHDAFDWKAIEANSQLIVDTRGRFTADNKRVFRA